MIDDNYSNICSEVLAILDKLPIEDYNKIPKSMIEEFENNKNPNYTFEYDYSKSLVDQKTDDMTKWIIECLFRDYIAIDEEKESIKEYERRKIDEEEKIKREKYNPDDLFSSTQDSKEQFEENSLIRKEDSLYKKILNWIKSIFKI